MSKERLERIKERINYHGHLDDDIDWLIKQAERVQELERQNKALGLEVDGWFNKANEIHESMLRQDKVIDKFRQQNKRYRETLKFYADEESYEEVRREAGYQGGEPIEPPSGEPPLIYYDKGQKARKALEGED